MPITIGTNIASLRGQRQLSRTSSELNSVFQRLSSGQRINKASDDAAGLAIADALKADTRVFTQAIRNINDGISALTIQEGALDALTSIVIRQQELAEQAANGVYNYSQRKALHDEANALVKEYNRIIGTTSFNGRKLLENPGEEIRIQAGYGIDGSLSFNQGEKLGRLVGDGSFESAGTTPLSTSARGSALADLNNDGNLDLIVNQGHASQNGSIALGNGDGTFQAASLISTGTGNSGGFTTVLTEDFNRDGNIDVAFVAHDDDELRINLGNGDGTLQAATIYTGIDNTRGIATADFDGDGYLDIIAAEGGRPVSLMKGNGDGTFQSATAISTATVSGAIVIGDLNNDGHDDIAVHQTDARLLFLEGNGDGTFNEIFAPSIIGSTDLTLSDINNDGMLDLSITHYSGTTGTKLEVFINQGGFSFIEGEEVATLTGPYRIDSADFNGDGKEDLVTTGPTSGAIGVHFGNGDGTFNDMVDVGNPGFSYSFSIGDVNNDGVDDIVSSPTNLLQASIYLSNTTLTNKQAHLNLGTQKSAREEMSILSDNLERITQEKGAIGSFLGRLEVASENLKVSRENFTSAASQIKDADIASDSAALVRNNILQQAATSVLANANQQPSLALALLS